MNHYCIGIPTYQQEPEILKKTLISILNQRYFLKGDYQITILITSDGQYEQSVINLIIELDLENQEHIVVEYDYTPKKSENLGASVKQHILEKAFHTVQSDYINFTDSDNTLFPDYLYEMTKVIEENDIDFAICKIIHFGPLFKEVAGRIPWVLEGYPKLYHIDTIQIMARTEALHAIGWEQVYGHCSDGITYERLAEKYKWINVDKILGIHW